MSVDIEPMNPMKLSNQEIASETGKAGEYNSIP